MENGKVLETLELPVYQSFCELFAEDLYEAVDLTACVNRRISEGGTSVESVRKQIADIRKILELQGE
jgi:argininosuccinate lyase